MHPAGQNGRHKPHRYPLCQVAFFKNSDGQCGGCSEEHEAEGKAGEQDYRRGNLRQKIEPYPAVRLEKNRAQVRERHNHHDKG